jgi:hypothetical protein
VVARLPTKSDIIKATGGRGETGDDGFLYAQVRKDNNATYLI